MRATHGRAKTDPPRLLCLVALLAVGLLPGSKMGLLGYSGDVKRLVENGTPSEIGSAIGQMAIDPEGAEVRALDAVRTAIDLLKAQEKGRRKLIILFSDGIDVNNEKKA